jgi:methionine synthase II (cobalamin-independent)
VELILANHSSYPRIGDRPEYQLLRRTIAQWEKGEKIDADLRAAEDRLTEYALADQIDAGLDIVTDGQIRWYDPVSHLAEKLSGIRLTFGDPAPIYDGLQALPVDVLVDGEMYRGDMGGLLRRASAWV